MVGMGGVGDDLLPVVDEDVGIPVEPGVRGREHVGHHRVVELVPGRCLLLYCILYNIPLIIPRPSAGCVVATAQSSHVVATRDEVVLDVFVLFIGQLII